jgi:hypothetical protein
MSQGEEDKRNYDDGLRVTNGESEGGESRGLYLVRGSAWFVWSLSLLEPHTRDNPEKPDEPNPRHAPREVPGTFSSLQRASFSDWPSLRSIVGISRPQSASEAGRLHVVVGPNV